MEQPNYHVLLDGRTVGPYDRRTIVGMRIKRMLTGDHLLVTAGGSQLTVRDLIGGAPGASRGARPEGSSRVLATATGILMTLEGRGLAIPRFKGEVEVRVRADVLRLAGRRRSGWGWKEDRVKLPIHDLVHARATGPRLDLWLRPAGSRRLQHLAMHMFTGESAREVLACLPPATTDPLQPGAVALGRGGRTWRGTGALAAAVFALALVGVLALLVRRAG